MQAVIASQRMQDSMAWSHECHMNLKVCGAVYTSPRWRRPTLRACPRLTSPSRRCLPALVLWSMISQSAWAPASERCAGVARTAGRPCCPPAPFLWDRRASEDPLTDA